MESSGANYVIIITETAQVMIVGAGVERGWQTKHLPAPRTSFCGGKKVNVEERKVIHQLLVVKIKYISKNPSRLNIVRKNI
jgi:hypothetical protein